jgi:hypothetical protein
VSAAAPLPRFESPDSALRSTARKHCAVVECYNRHDEVYLTTVYLLEQLGYEVHVFNTWRNRLKNSFVHAQSLSCEVVSKLKPAQVLDAAKRKRFDLVVFNTLEGSGVLQCAREVLAHTPILGFIHNGGFIREKPEYESLLGNPRLKLMTLAPYVAHHFSDKTQAGSMYPLFFFDREIPSAPRGTRRRFCVQGYFDPTRRHYGQLLECLQALKAEGRDDFEVYVMGRSFGKSFREFAATVHQSGLAENIRYTWKGIGYRAYYRLLNSVDFILPLISPGSHPAYFSNKSTSSVAATIGFEKIGVLHQDLARHYGIEDISFTYDTDLLSAMRRALTTSPSTLAELKVRMKERKAALLQTSLQQLQSAIGAVTS